MTSVICMKFFTHEFLYQDNDFAIMDRRLAITETPIFRLHTHSFFEITYIREIDGTFRIEGNEAPLRAGDILITRPGEAHHIMPKPHSWYSRVVIRFTMEFLKYIDPTGQLIVPFMDRDVGRQNLYPASRFKNSAHSAYIASMVSEPTRVNFLVQLIGLLQLLGKHFTYAAQELPDTIEYRILRYIDGHLSSNLQIEQLCRQFFLSRTQLCTRFKQATGYSVGQYITERRMLLAHQLIEKGCKPTQVCAQCGFRDYSTFYRAYTKYHSHSPKSK